MIYEVKTYCDDAGSVVQSRTEVAPVDGAPPVVKWSSGDTVVEKFADGWPDGSGIARFTYTFDLAGSPATPAEAFAAREALVALARPDVLEKMHGDHARAVLLNPHPRVGGARIH